MSKAEERALECIPTHPNEGLEEQRKRFREFYVEGYEQAEKDLVNHTLHGLSNFIYSLEQEQAQGLDEAAEEYSKCYAHCFNGNSLDDAIYLAFKAGAKWMDEQGNDNLPNVRGWVVRLKNGDLGLSTDKPYFLAIDEGKIICCDNGLIIDNSLFPELKWEDEPIEVELTIKRV